MDWFEAGTRVLAGQRDDALYPPLDDPAAQRWWLGGFGGAWAELPDGSAPVDEALIAALAGREALLRQLWDLGLGRIQRSVQ